MSAMSACHASVAPAAPRHGVSSARLSLAGLLPYVPRLLSDRAEALRQIGLDHGDVVEVPLPGKRLWLVTHPAHAQHVLQHNNKNYRRSFDYRIVRSFLGDGLITTHDASWQHARRAVRPGFGKDQVRSLTDRIVCEVDRFERDRLGARVATVSANAAMSALSLRMFGGAMLSRDVSRDEEAILDATGIVLRHIDRRLVAPFDVDAYLPTPSGARFARARRRFDAIVMRFIAERRADAAPKDDLMALLLLASESFEPTRCDVWLRDQLTTYLMAGHETIAVALSWCLYLLDAHRDVQDRVRAECRDALGASAPPAAGFRELPLTQAVIEEAMRLYPPVWSVGREAIGEDMLGDARVPVGATVMISPYALHRRPDFWDAPEAFRPERFLGSTDRHPFVYVPFGAGARSCIGNHVSMLEMRVALSMIVRRYAIERTSREPVATEALVSLRPKPDFDVRLTRID